MPRREGVCSEVVESLTNVKAKADDMWDEAGSIIKTLEMPCEMKGEKPCRLNVTACMYFLLPV
ncbi:MAG: hypothetical protein P8012_04180 [Desulfobacterales bacterium]